MFLTILLSVLTLLHVYIFWRAASVQVLVRNVSRKITIGVGAALWTGLFFGLIVGHHGSGALAVMLDFFAMYWMAVIFLLFVCLFTVDVITGFGFFIRPLASSLRGWALIIGIALSVIAIIQGFRPPVVQSYEVRLSGLPHEMDGTVLVALSDLHLGSSLGAEWLAARVAQVRAERPDIVVLLGDLFEGHGSPSGDIMEALSRLSAPLGVWAVPGNHEFHHGGDTNMHLINEAGFRLLRDRGVEVRPGFFLAGVDDLTSRRRAGMVDDSVSKVLANRASGAAILLSHTPWQAERAVQAGAGLMLSGHTHGGQIWPFGYVVRHFYPLMEGRYEVDGMTVIVCRGTGTWGPRMRLWRRGEILRVTMRTRT